MNVVEFDDLVAVCNGDSEAFVERLAASPASPAAAARVMSHVSVFVHHEDAATVLLDQTGSGTYEQQFILMQTSRIKKRIKIMKYRTKTLQGKGKSS